MTCQHVICFFGNFEHGIYVAELIASDCLSSFQESLYYDTRHFLRFRDLSIYYKHYMDTGEPNTDPLIIQNVPIWAKMEETGNDDTSEKFESVHGTLDEGGAPMIQVAILYIAISSFAFFTMCVLQMRIWQD